MDKILRLEGLALGGAAIYAFHSTNSSWFLFAVLILAPDLAMIGYLAGPKVGAVCYNIVHTWLAPVALLVGYYVFTNDYLLQVALIWAVHIGFDRALGYGLKRYSGFRHTHLGIIGSAEK